MVLLITISSIKVSNAETCIAAADFGLGGTVYVFGNPEEDPGLDVYTHKDPRNPSKTFKSKLLRVDPKGQQVAQWVDAQLFTTGKAKNFEDSENRYFTNLKGFIEGGWYPWGNTSEENCNLLGCVKTLSKHAICLDGGIIVDDDPDHVYPCKLKNGLGLYGLIAIDNNGSQLNPNELINALSLPSAYFRTFHAYPVKEGRRPGEVYFEITHTQVCENNEEGETVCVTDKDENGEDYIRKGRLYFKILDRHYQDNAGLYTVNIVSGVYGTKGFIEDTISSFEDAIKKVTSSIYTHISQDLKFIGLCRAMLLMYVAFTGVGFMMGIVQLKQQELVIRLFKVGLIATLISESSWEFFNTSLFQLFTEGADSVATIIMRSTLYRDGSVNEPIFIIPENASALAVFDIFLRMIISKPVNVKIISLLFYDWKFYLIPAIYIGIFFILMGILQAVFMYILAIMQMALLLVVAPIFIIMVLFKMTKELFDGWIKQLINSSILIILTVSTIALMMTLILEQLQALLYYEVCWTSVWDLEILDLEIFNLKFWYPYSSVEVKSAITLLHYVAFLLVCLLFDSVLKQVPVMTDALSGASRPTAAQGVQAMTGPVMQNVNMIMSKVQAINPIGAGFDKLTGMAKGIPGVGQVVGMAEKYIRDPKAIDSQINSLASGSKFEAPGSIVPDLKESGGNLTNTFTEGFKTGFDSTKDK
jgi:type IV secretion system protein VirB6